MELPGSNFGQLFVNIVYHLVTVLLKYFDPGKMKKLSLFHKCIKVIMMHGIRSVRCRRWLIANNTKIMCFQQGTMELCMHA